MSMVKELLKDIIIVVVVVLVVTFFIKPVIVKGTSMVPNFETGNYVIVSKQAYRFGEPKKGQVVVFPVQTVDGKELYIKRVVGLPGDVIDINDGEVYVNDKKQNQDFTNDGYTPGEKKDFKVPDGELFVMGDNRVVSIDSRYEEVGTVPIKKITGVAVFRVWPFNEFGKIEIKN